jgi:hypothetical protein
MSKAEILLRKVVTCDENDHPNPAAYVTAMRRIANEIRACLSSTYNGWKNRQTWNVALWMQNDETLYHTARACGSYQEFVDQLREAGVLETPDAVSYNDSGLDTAALDDLIRESR